MKKEQFLVRVTERRDGCVETRTPWTGKQYEADSDDAMLAAYTTAVASLEEVVKDQVSYCKIRGQFGPDREQVEHTVHLLCYDGDRYEIWKTVQFD